MRPPSENRPGAPRPRLLLLLLAVVGLGLAPALSAPAAGGNGYHVRRWTANDGLPQNTVQAIAQTPDGYLWLGTTSGLARFDGLRFTVFDESNTPALGETGDAVHALAVDTEGRLWVGCGDGLVVYRGGGVASGFSVAFRGGGGDRVFSLEPAGDGGVWATHSDGLIRARGDGDASLDRRFLGGRDAVLDTGGGELLCFADGGLASYDLVTGEVRHLAPSPDPGMAFRSIARCADGGLWVAFNGGLWRPPVAAAGGSNDDPRIIPAGPWSDRHAKALHLDRRGRLWAGYGVSPPLHWVDDDRLVPFAWPGGAVDPPDAVFTLFEDRDGNLWVGSERNGLYQLRPVPLRTVTVPGGRATNDVWSVTQGSGGEIWLGTPGGLVRDPEGAAENVTGPVMAMPARALASGLVASSAGVWDGSRLHDWPGGATAKFKSSTYYRCLVEDGEGGVLVGFGGRSFRYRQGDGGWVADPAGLALTGGEHLVNALRAADGSWWYGVAGRGIVHQPPASAAAGRTYTVDDGLIGRIYAPVHEDAEGRIWCGSDRGIFVIESGRLASFTSADGLPNPVVLDLLEDGAGWLWANTHRGVFRVRRADLIAYRDGRLAEVDFVHYLGADGMRSVEGNGGCFPNSLRAADGRLWFPTTGGVVVADPDEIHRSEHAPPVVIEAMGVNRAWVTFNGPPGEAGGGGAPAPTEALAGGAGPAGVIQLPPGSGRLLEFRYTAPTFAAAGRVRFRTRLLGLEETWHDAGDRRVAYYTNLAPGDYRFEVKASHPLDPWSDDRSATAFAFSVEPFFYQTLAFKILCAAAAVLAASGVQAYRLAVQRKILRAEQAAALHAERARLADDMHDQLGSDLTRIHFLAESALRSGAPGDPASAAPAREKLAAAAAAARSAVDQLGEIVWATDPGRDDLPAFLRHLRETAAEILQAAPGVRPVLDFPPDPPPLPVSPTLRRNLSLVLREALTNAVKHSGAKTVTVGAVLRGGTDLPKGEGARPHFTLRVADDGVGFSPPSTSGRGLGLRSMFRRVEAVGGAFELGAKPGEGTTVTVRIALG